MEKRKDFDYLYIELENLKGDYDKYNKKMLEIDKLTTRLISVINIIGMILDKDNLHDDLSEALRFLWNVNKHDKEVIQLSIPCTVMTPVCGRFRCGQQLNFSNSHTTPIILLKDLKDNTIRNQKGFNEYEKMVKHKNLEEFIKIIKNRYLDI